jgi:hypothetical protein
MSISPKRLRRRGVPGLSDYEKAFAELSVVSARGWLDADATMKQMMARFPTIAQYGFAIPCEEAIAAVAKLPQPIVEVGAGLAYWSHLVRDRYGVRIDAYEKNIPPTMPQGARDEGPMTGYGFDREPWYPVMAGTEDSIARKPYRTLLLIWPDLHSPMASRCLQKFRGDVLAYVGEVEGCTGDAAFHKELGRSWTLTEEVWIPQWFAIHDSLMIYTRK